MDLTRFNPSIGLTSVPTRSLNMDASLQSHYSGTCRRGGGGKPTMKQKKMSATSSGIVELPLPAPERQSSRTPFDQDDDCRCDYGSVGEHARKSQANTGILDAQSSDHPCRENETKAMSPARQTTRENQVQARGFLAWDKSQRSPRVCHIQRRATPEHVACVDPLGGKRVERKRQRPLRMSVRPPLCWQEPLRGPHERLLGNGRWLLPAGTVASASVLQARQGAAAMQRSGLAAP